MNCDTALEAISAAADGEVDDDATLTAVSAHVGRCPECARFEQTVTRVRAGLRFEPVASAAPVPVGSIQIRPRSLRGSEAEPASIGAVAPSTRASTPGSDTGMPDKAAARWMPAAAAAVVGLVVGATVVGVGRDPTSPAAADIAARVLDAQHEIDTLDIRFTLTERGRPDAPDGRELAGHLTYEAPETLSLTLTEDEDDPASRPAEGDVRLVVNDDAWQLDAVRACTLVCPEGATSWRRTVTDREPFSDTAPIPLELVTAIDSFTLSAALPSLGERRVAGRDAVGVRVTAAQVARFLTGLSPAGDLRAAHPTDPVEVWLDDDSLVPLALTVRAGTAPERDQWASAHGYRDRPGDTVLEYTARSVRIGKGADLDRATASAGGDEQAEPPRPGQVPPDTSRTVAPEQQTVVSEGFHPGNPDFVPPPTALPQGFESHLVGTVTKPGGPQVGVRSWTDGRAWITVRATETWTGSRLFGELGPAVRVVDLGSAGQGHVSADGRRVALHTGRLDVVVAGSVGPDDLWTVAASLSIEGESIPASWPEASTVTLAEARRAHPGLLVAETLDGFAPPVVQLGPTSVTQQYSGPGDRGIVLTQSTNPELAPPSDAVSLGVQVRGVAARYSPARGDLEWVADGESFSVASPTLSLAELVAVAESLAPAS